MYNELEALLHQTTERLMLQCCSIAALPWAPFGFAVHDWPGAPALQPQQLDAHRLMIS